MRQQKTNTLLRDLKIQAQDAEVKAKRDVEDEANWQARRQMDMQVAAEKEKLRVENAMDQEKSTRLLA